MVGFRFRYGTRAALIAIAFVAVASNAGVASAAIIRVQIDTTLSQVFSLQHTSLPMSVGDPVSLTFDYDDAAPDLNPVAGSGHFQNAIVEATVVFPNQSLSFTFSGFSVLGTIDDQDSPTPIIIDSFGFNSLGDDPLAGDTLEGDTPTAMTFGFAQGRVGAAPTLVVNDFINPPFSFDGLGASQINLIGPIGTTGHNFVDVFGLNAGSAIALPVPEPSLAALALLGALGLGRSARR